MRRRTVSTPLTCAARNASSNRSSCTSTAASAARHQASVPGRTRRWKSASFAVSVSTGSITIIERAGSLAISLSTTRARGKPCDIHGFFPTNTETSACSKSPRVCAAEEVGVDPGLAGLLLCERVRAVVRPSALRTRRCTRRRGGCPARRRRSRRSCRRRTCRAMRLKPAAISAIAVSQSISS